MSAPNESKISTTCAACAKPTAASCSRCRLAHYCGPECQRAQWPAHKEPCRRAGALRALPAVPADLPVKVAALAARGLTAVFAYVAGPRYENDAVINAMSEFEYFLAGIVGDVATGTPCLPDAVNGSLVNDPMTAETYGLLTQGDLSRALAAYYRQDVRYRNAEALEPTVGNATEIYTIHDIAAGEELLVGYGPYYWVQMLAGKRLAGTTFHAAWSANMFLLKGDTKCFAALLEIAKLADAPWEQQAAFLGEGFGMSGGAVPLWLKWEGVRLVFAGVAGVSYHGYCHSGVEVYVRAPGIATRRRRPAQTSWPFAQSSCSRAASSRWPPAPAIGTTPARSSASCSSSCPGSSPGSPRCCPRPSSSTARPTPS